MNIPKDKANEFRSQTNEKKWRLVISTRMAQSRHPPEFYLDGLLAHLDAIDKQRRKKAKTKKLPPNLESADELLKGLEISLRTNSLA